MPPVTKGLTRPAVPRSRWLLDPTLTFLNHGSFGACPKPVLRFQRALQERLERQPIQFFVRDLEALWDNARTCLSRFLHAHPSDLVGIPNATAGVNTVLRSLSFRPGDELLVTDHEYNACRNVLNFVAQQHRARVVVVPIPFPLKDADQILDAVSSRVTRRTRLLLIDHVTSPTGLVLPIEQLIGPLRERNVDTLVDGAHAPGMIDLNLDRLGAAYYTGNCHKWLCSPKGAAFLHVRRDRQRSIRPLIISHGANSSRTDRSRFLIEFGWMGTQDPTAWLAVPAALTWMNAQPPGGWAALRKRNRQLALAARSLLCHHLGIEKPCPDSLVGSLAAVPLPKSRRGSPPRSPLYLDPLQDELLARYQIEVPVIPWPAPPHRLLRVSAQLYNALPDYERLADALTRTLRLTRFGPGR